MKQESSIKAVIFDIDGTLTTRISWNYLVEYLGGSAEEERQNYLDFKSGRLSAEETDKNLLKLWHSGNRGNKSQFKQAFETIPLRPDAQDLIEYLKSKQIKVCLITGAMDLFAETMARRLGVEYFYANAILHWNENDEIVKFDYTPAQGLKKLEQFQDFCRRYNLKLEECAAVGDSDNDYELFKATGHGIAVRTEYEDKILEQLAWHVVDHLVEIKQII